MLISLYYACKSRFEGLLLLNKPNAKPKSRPAQVIAGAGETLPIELVRAAEKFERQQAGIVKADGYGASVEALRLSLQALTKLTESIRKSFTEAPRLVHRDLSSVISHLKPPEVLSWCILQEVFHSIGQQDDDYRKTALRVGRAIEGLCWAQDLLEKHPKLAKGLVKQAQEQHHSSKRRLQIAQAQAARYGYKTKDWNSVHYLQAGTWALDRLLDALPNIFFLKDEKEVWRGKMKTTKFLRITEGAQAHVDAIVAEIISRNPVWLPSAKPPLDWTDWDRGWTDDKQLALSLSLVRTRYKKQTRDAVKKAIRDGTMKPALDALNALQGVPWKINQPILRVMIECDARGIKVDGMPERALQLPKVDEGDQGLWSLQQKVSQVTRKFTSRRTLFKEDVKTAEALAEHERFWTPMNLDWRGRVNALPHFNFQRDDRIRALFLFAEGAPIGEEGLYWLKVHLANCGDFNRISKKPFADRVQWVDDNLARIRAAAEAPLEDCWWRTVDAPFQFLAACMELSSALEEGPTYVSNIPVTFDGSCNGLQHLCAMTRAADEGALVNLTPSVLPQDIYQTVADWVRDRVENDDDKKDRTVRQQWLKHGITRKVVKRNVMTYFYNSKPYGMADQIREEIMQPLAERVLRGELERHPFGEDNGNKASRYLSKKIYNAIKEKARFPAKAMDFLQRVTRAAAHKNKPLQWRTPVGLPWINRYHEGPAMVVSLWLQGKVCKLNLAPEETSTIDSHKATNGAAPNFVHACDAAHLMLTVNAAVAEGITSIATVHDSFGCLPSRAERFRRIIREQFVKMYQEHDVLQEVFERAKEDLRNAKVVSSGPPRGSLDIKQVLGAEYAFS
jgi:DNA-directed RNA polymerase, mitochondrial